MFGRKLVQLLCCCRPENKVKSTSQNPVQIVKDETEAISNFIPYYGMGHDGILYRIKTSVTGDFKEMYCIESKHDVDYCRSVAPAHQECEMDKLENKGTVAMNSENGSYKEKIPDKCLQYGGHYVNENEFKRFREIDSLLGMQKKFSTVSNLSNAVDDSNFEELTSIENKAGNDTGLHAVLFPESDTNHKNKGNFDLFYFNPQDHPNCQRGMFEKYKRKMDQIQQLVYECNNATRHVLDNIRRSGEDMSPTDLIRTLQWFKVKKELLKQTWRTLLLTSEECDLMDVESNLMSSAKCHKRISRHGRFMHEAFDEWIQISNRITEEIFQLRKNMFENGNANFKLPELFFMF